MPLLQHQNNVMYTRLKPLIICAFAIVLAFSSKAIETVRISKKLQWTDFAPANEPSGYLADFADAYRDAAFGDLPFFVHRQGLKDFSSVGSFQFENIETASLNSDNIRPEDFGFIQSEWQVRTKITEGAGNPFLIVLVLPIRNSAFMSLERLVSFDLTIELNAAPKAKANLRSLSFADESVLREGNWFKLGTARDGVYKIDKNLLNQLGIDITTLDVSAINIYGNGGELLPELNSVTRPDDLQKCAIHIEGDADGDFNDSDYILFYAKGPDTWKSFYDASLGESRWIHNKHYYSDSAYYFLRTDDQNPLRIQNISSSEEQETHTVNRFQDYVFVENDIYNLAKSGRESFGDEFYLNTSATYSLPMPNMLSEFPATFETRLAVRSIGGGSNFTVNVGGTTLESNAVTSFEGALASVAGLSTLKTTFNPSGSTVPVNMTFNKYSNTAEVRGYIDFMRLNATRSLILSGSQMKFRDTTNVGPGMIGRFDLSGTNSQTKVWDITDITHPTRILISNFGNSAEWKMSTDVLREYIAFSNSGFPTPSALGRVANQNLHALSDIDLVIVSSPQFMDAANQVAEIHTADGLSVVVTTVYEIFNEFSSGNPDVTAIRTFMKMLYDRAAGDESKLPENLLMFGDGEYNNNKGIRAFTGSNVMIFESEESLSPVNSYVSDDYFVMLSDDDDASYLNYPDLGVGRIPASNLAEANDYVEKIKAYISSNTSVDGGASCLGDENQTPFGPWRNILTFIADDQDGSGPPIETTHLRDADQLSALMKERHPEYDIVKIYLDAYKQVSTPGGERYPEAEIAIKNRVQNGSLIVTYLGHGGERGWAHERILDINTISSWTNKYKMPIFLTATCELARYDDPSFNTAGEILVMNPDGGAIAMLTTTRVVFAGSNMEMDLAFFDVALEEQNISKLTLGKINLMTKNGVNESNTSKPNFSLLGDPALKMVYPKFNVFTTQINNVPIENFSDTLKALQEIEFTGFVGNGLGEKLTDFNGFIYPTVFDKLTHVYTQNNDFDGEYGVVQEYDVFNKNIFKGKASVTGGDFSFKFIVPYDINYTVDSGRVSYYAVSGNNDAHGYSQDFRIGGSLSNVELNTVGPEIDLYLNDTTFVSGGLSNTEPILLGYLRDENGINTVGNGIGHDLTAILDSDSQNPIVLNEYYETNLDTYKSGIVRYQMPELAVGDHSISMKAWDVHNNSSSSTLTFTVAESSAIALQHVLNYPNPFTTHTDFMFEHNQVCTMLQVRVQVFTVSGKLVKTIDQEVIQEGFRSSPISWDGTDDFGDRIGRGVYVYKIEVLNEDGQKAEQYEKLVILK
jgi:hypothetical protein